MENNKTKDKSSWIIGGMTMVGIGVGLFFLQTNPIYFVACIFSGIGIGLLMTSLISKK